MPKLWHKNGNHGEQKRNGRSRGSPAPSPCVWRAFSRTPRLRPDHRDKAAKPCVSSTQSGTLADRIRPATTKFAIHKVVPWKAHLSRLDPPNRPPAEPNHLAGTVPDGV